MIRLTPDSALVHDPADDSFTVRQLTRNVVLDDHGLHGVIALADVLVAEVLA